MNSTDAPTPPRAEKLTAATLATLAVASVLAAGTVAETVPPRKTQKPPTYVAGGMWGGV